MTTEMWDLSIPGAPRQLVTGESIVVPRPTGAPLSGQWGTMLPLLDSLNPPRAWLAAAGYYVGYYVGSDLGAGWQLPTIGLDDHSPPRPAAVRTAAPLPLPQPDPRESSEIAAAIAEAIEDEAVRRFALAVEPRYRAAAEQAGWSALFAEAVAYGQSGTLGPWLVAETEGLSAADRSARIAAIAERGGAYIGYRAAVVRARRTIEAELAALLAPIPDELEPGYYAAELAARPALLALEASVAAHAAWPAVPIQ